MQEKKSSEGQKPANIRNDKTGFPCQDKDNDNKPMPGQRSAYGVFNDDVIMEGENYEYSNDDLYGDLCGDAAQLDAQ